jgi:hypothetical protein
MIFSGLPGIEAIYGMEKATPAVAGDKSHG